MVPRTRFSGGLIEELLHSLPRVVGTTTCTRKGYGYDNPTTHSGAWTHGFLTQGLMLRPDADLGALYTEARRRYITQYPSAGDRPCFFGRTDNVAPCNTESLSESEPPPHVFHARDWLA